MPKKGWRKPVVGDTDDPEGLIAWSRKYVEQLRAKGYSERTLVTTRGYLMMFAEWAFLRGITRPSEVTRDLLERYQRSMFHMRKPNGRPLLLSSQRARQQKVRGLFRWLAKTRVIPHSPAAEVDLPRLERRLPRAVLTQKEVEQVLAMPDLGRPTGLRDRAMMEVLLHGDPSRRAGSASPRGHR